MKILLETLLNKTPDSESTSVENEIENTDSELSLFFSWLDEKTKPQPALPVIDGFEGYEPINIRVKPD
jgi:hypothetical protein